MLQTVSLLGVKISQVSLPMACNRIIEWVSEKHRTYVCVAPVATLVDAKRDEFYRSVVNGAGMVTPDGMPVVWLARMKGCHKISRTYGPDLMHEVCQHGQRAGIKHFFYGSSEDTLKKLTQELKGKYPAIKIVGSYAPPFFSTVQQEHDEIIARMNAANADILWVGLGSPKQDLWMHTHRALINASVIIGAGAAFDFVARVKPQAPRWMQRSGLEWLFRLGCEPQRLWKRYLVGNTLFCWYVLLDLVKKDKT